MDVNQEVERSVERVRLELVGRKLMVMALAVTFVLMGASIILTGAPDFVEVWFSPWSRYLVGGWAMLAGALVVSGGTLTDRTRCGWWNEVVGLVGMTGWCLMMATVYFCRILGSGAGFVGPGEPLSAGVTGRVYVPILYLGLMFIIAVPLTTLLRLSRPDVLGPLDD